MKTIYFKIAFISFSYLLLQGCGGSTNAYLKSKNPNITWMDKEAIKKKRELPTQYAYQDENYIYCYGISSAKPVAIGVMGFSTVIVPKAVPLFYQLDKKTFDIVKTSKSEKDEKYRSLFIRWTEKAGWIIFDDNKKNKIDEYKVRKISLDGLEPAKNLFRLEAEKSNSQFDDGFYFNSDSTKLTYYSAEYIGKDDRVSFNVVCFDFLSMTKLWSHKYTFPHAVKRKKDVSGTNIMVNKNGEPHFLLKTYFEKRKEKKKDEDGNIVANYNFRYYVLTAAGKVEEYKVDTKGDFIQSIAFPFQNQYNPVIVAYTYKKNNFKELKSIIFKRIDLETKEITNLKEITLDTKYLKIYDESGEKIKQNKDFQDVSGLKVQSIKQSEDGSIYVMGEEEELVENCTTDSKGRTRCTYYWRSGNILVTKVSSDGKESWTKIIPKSQFINTAYSLTKTGDLSRCHGHKSMIIDNKLHLFFNDNAKNYNTKKALTKINKFNGKNASLVHVIIDGNGTYEMIETLGPKDHPRIVDISSIENIDSDNIFLFDYKSIGKLKIDR